MGGIGLGVMGAFGLLVLMFFFDLPPTLPSFKVIMVMIGALTAGAALEGAGTLDWLTYHAGRLLMKHPRYLVWLSPLLTYGLVWLVGTSHIIYVLLPVIATIAQKSGIRPEKPLVASVLASQQALLASPVSAATAITLAHLSGGSGLSTLLAIFIPATLVGTLAATCMVFFTKKDFDCCMLRGQSNVLTYYKPKPFAFLSLLLFLIAISGVVLCSNNAGWLNKGGKEMALSHFICMVMLAVAAIITGLVGTRTIAKTRVFTIGMQAVIAITGVTWLSNSFLMHHKETLQAWTRAYFTDLWQWGLLLFIMTIISNSQSATLQIMIPWALTTLTPTLLCCILPAANSFYVLPSYPTILAAVALDKTGSTQAGGFVFNHSFLLPGLVGTLASCGTAYVIMLLRGDL